MVVVDDSRIPAVIIQSARVAFRDASPRHSETRVVARTMAPREVAAADVFLRYSQHTERDVRRVFARYDRDGDGRIVASELKSLLRDVGLMSPLDTAADAAFLREQFATADRDGDGAVGYDEFAAYLRTVAAPSAAGDAVVRAKTAARSSGKALRHRPATPTRSHLVHVGRGCATDARRVPRQPRDARHEPPRVPDQDPDPAAVPPQRNRRLPVPHPRDVVSLRDLRHHAVPLLLRFPSRLIRGRVAPRATRARRPPRRNPRVGRHPAHPHRARRRPRVPPRVRVVRQPMPTPPRRVGNVRVGRARAAMEEENRKLARAPRGDARGTREGTRDGTRKGTRDGTRAREDALSGEVEGVAALAARRDALAASRDAVVASLPAAERPRPRRRVERRRRRRGQRRVAVRARRFTRGGGAGAGGAGGGGDGDRWRQSRSRRWRLGTGAAAWFGAATAATAVAACAYGYGYGYAANEAWVMDALERWSVVPSAPPRRPRRFRET